MDIVLYFGCSLRTDGYCDLSFDTFQFIIENCCDYYDYLLVLSSCSWRTDVNNVEYLLMLSNHLYRTKVILYDSLICDFMSLAKLGCTLEAL